MQGRVANFFAKETHSFCKLLQSYGFSCSDQSIFFQRSDTELKVGGKNKHKDYAE
jgi:hypothetical protein